VATPALSRTRNRQKQRNGGIIRGPYARLPSSRIVSHHTVIVLVTPTEILMEEGTSGMANFSPRGRTKAGGRGRDRLGAVVSSGRCELAQHRVDILALNTGSIRKSERLAAQNPGFVPSAPIKPATAVMMPGMLREKDPFSVRAVGFLPRRSGSRSCF
jgi:hypothetical protein